MRPQEYAKAIIGAVLAGLTTAQVAWQSERIIDTGEWIGVAVAVFTVFAGVFGLPNAAKRDVVSQQTVTVETTQVDVETPKHVADPITGL